MNLVGWFLKTNEERMRGSALAYERTRASAALVSPQQAYRGALDALAGAEALPLGVTDRGDPLRVGLETLDRHAVIAGATGSGKTRAILDRLLKRCVLGLWRRFEFELFDPKSETFTELKKHLAAWWLVSDERVREEIARSVHVIDWTRDRITPTAPYDNSDGVMTDAYAAELHTRVTIEASEVNYTDSLRQLLFMWSYLLIDLRYPPNFNFALRFFRDATFRKHVLSRVKSGDVRQYFAVLGQITAQQTQDAFLRRIWAEQAFPEYRYATSIPPTQLDRLGLPTDVRWTLANFGTTNAQPQSLGHARFRWHVVRRLLSAPRRQTTAPLWMVFEELPVLLAGSPEVTDLVMNALRTLRSCNVALMLCAQSLSGTLPKPVVENVLLNTHTWSMFQTRPDEAEFVYPHVIVDGALGASESERRREFARQMQSLPRQYFYFLAKGHPALRCRTSDVPPPSAAAHRSEEELLDIFDRNLAPTSMIPVDLAARLIEEWEAEVLGQQQVRENAPAPRPRSDGVDGGLDQLRRILNGGSESGK
ncbi:MAG TPA: hypothetical protein VE974_16090 [Thermoanaerobaculia bacterium]|nr:hypothetical protein [Thermoanaerobaculia bacterium]